MRNLREYSRQTTVRLIIGAVLILLIVGEGLIFLIYGAGGAISGLLCIGAGLLPIFIIIGILAILDWVVRRNQEKNN